MLLLARYARSAAIRKKYNSLFHCHRGELSLHNYVFVLSVEFVCLNGQLISEVGRQARYDRLLNGSVSHVSVQKLSFKYMAQLSFYLSMGTLMNTSNPK